MRFEDLYEFTETKFGEKLTFDVQQETEFPGAPAWVLYQITSFVDGQEAGYLKISYIPEENWKLHNGTIFHFAGRNGESALQDLSPARSIKKLSDQDIELIIKVYTSRLEWRRPRDEIQAIREAPIEEKREIVRTEARKFFTRDLGEKYKKAYAFHVDKPLVDYIQVYDDFRRRGIALALYVKGAEWAADRGLALWASGLQQPEAKAAWAKMQEKGWVEQVDGRQYLAYNNIAF
jgi:GNAT superfamily N-acetyltransferase